MNILLNKRTPLFLIVKKDKWKKDAAVWCVHGRGEKGIVGPEWNEGDCMEGVGKRSREETEERVERNGRERIGASARDVCSVSLLDPDAIFFFYVMPFLCSRLCNGASGCNKKVVRG